MAQTKTADGTEAAAAATDDKPKPKRISRRKRVEAHARSYFDALGARDIRAIGDHWREDGVAEIVPLGLFRGRAEVMDFFRETFAAAPDMETTVHRVVAAEQSVAVEWRMEGTFDGEPFQGIDPTGKRLEIRGFDLLEIEDDEIVSNTAYYDGMAFARQIGMMPEQDSGPERALKGAFNALTKARRTIADRAGT
jgi:steroid delta-isomerase-like uncharacterized protein